MRSRSAIVISSAAFAALVVMLFPPRAQAHDNGLYISLKYGTTDVDASFGDAFDQILDGDDDSQAIEAGFRWSPYFAIQAGYHDFGKVTGVGDPCPDDAEVCVPIEVPIEAETEAFSLSIVPQFPLGKRLSVFGKIGAIALQTEVDDSADLIDFVGDIDEQDVLFGAGVRLGIFWGIQVFYEYEWVGDDFETQSFGASWQF
jgi:hypothetical protein